MRRRPAKPLIVIGDTVLTIRDHVPALAAEGMGFSVALSTFRQLPIYCQITGLLPS
jgi:hypothetical protein